MSFLFSSPTDQTPDHTLAKVWISRPGGPGDPDPIPGEPTGPYPVGGKPCSSYSGESILT